MSKKDSNKKTGWLGWIAPPYFKKRRTYEPFYDEQRDFNTNAKSYYDYLARFNRYLGIITDFINRLMNRDIEVKDTQSVEFIKNGDWLDNGECEPDNFDDVIKLMANVKLSSETVRKNFALFGEYDFKNSIDIKNDGLFSPDYLPLLRDIDAKINKIESDLNQLENRVTNVENRMDVYENALQKIIDNLFESGAITNNNINNFNFKNGRDIATGNINLFGGTPDGDSFIRTNSGKTENDITAGI